MERSAEQKYRRRLGGFTLIESIFAIAILMLGVIAFGPLALATKKLSTQSVLREVATGYAKQQMEELKQTSFALLQPGSTVNLTLPADVVASIPVAQTGPYPMKAQYTVTPTSSPTLNQLSIRVWWSSAAAAGSVSSAPVSEVRLSELVALQPGDPSYAG